MTEELKIKLVVDTSALDKVRKSVSQSKSPSLTNKNDKNNIKEINGSLVQLQGTMESIKRLNFADLLKNAFKTDDVKRATADIKKYWSLIKNTFSKDGGILRDDAGQFFGTLFRRKRYLENLEPNANIRDVLGIQLRELGISSRLFLQDIKGLTKGIFAGIKGALKAISGIITGALVVGTYMVLRNAVKTAHATRQIETNARRIGMDVNSYKKWGYVVKQVGGDIQDLTDFVRTLSSEQAKAREGNQDTIKSFEELGISAEKLATMNQQELFEETVRGLASVEDQVKKTSLAYRIFGEDDAAHLTNILSLTSEQIATLERNYALLGGYATENLIAQSSTLTQTTNNLSVAWQGLKNVLAEAVLPAINAVASGLVYIIAVIGAFLGAIFDIGSGTEKTFDSATKSVDNLGKAFGGAGAGASKLKRAIMGFDELNILPGKDSGGGGGGGGFGGFGGTGLNPDDLLGEGNQGLFDSIERAKAWIEQNKQLIEDITATALTIGGLAIAIANFASGNIPLGIAGLAMLGIGVGVGLGEEGTWARLGEKFREGFETFKTESKKAFNDWWKSIQDWWAQAKIDIGKVFNKEYWKKEWEKIKKPFDDFWEQFSGSFHEDMEDLKEWFNTHFGKYFTKDYWSQKWENIKTSFSNFTVGFRQKLDDWKTQIKEWFNTNIKQFFTKDYWSQKWDTIQISFTTFKMKFKKALHDAWISIKKWFVDTIKPIFTADYWGEKFSSIGQGAKGAFNALIGIVETAVNAIIRKLNTLSWNVPDWVPRYGGNHFGFDISPISIPRLAKGGIATNSTLANIGEAGAEAILPLENNTSWMDALVEKINNRQPSKIVLNVDGRELGWATIDNINNITRQTGGIQLVL